jgi:hypothetical protein
MERVYFADHHGKPILRVTYSGLRDPHDLQAVAQTASMLVQQYPPGSLLVLADVSGVPHSIATSAVMQQGIAESRPHVRARAVIGLAPEAAHAFDVAAKLFGNPMARFDDPETALDWLLGFF